MTDSEKIAKLEKMVIGLCDTMCFVLRHIQEAGEMNRAYDRRRLADENLRRAKALCELAQTSWMGQAQANAWKAKECEKTMRDFLSMDKPSEEVCDEV